MVDKKLAQLKTEDRVNQMLEEVRIVIPGTQVFFGFQLMVVFQESFQNLPHSLQTLHFMSLLSLFLAIIFLLSPSSYDRILENEETVGHFRRFSRWAIMLALFLLALGSSLDLFVITQVLEYGKVWGLVLAGGLFLFATILWFLVPWSRKKQGVQT